MILRKKTKKWTVCSSLVQPLWENSFSFPYFTLIAHLKLIQCNKSTKKEWLTDGPRNSPIDRQIDRQADIHTDTHLQKKKKNKGVAEKIKDNKRWVESEKKKRNEYR